jgi:hypothetical protein
LDFPLLLPYILVYLHSESSGNQEKPALEFISLTWAEPREIKRGVWEIDVIATRVVLEQGIGESREQFNRTFTVKAVEIPKSPLKENANELEKTIHSLRAAGLEISRIVEFKP